MRHDSTDAEALLWWSLRNREFGVHFRRQHPIGKYIVDFVCLEHLLVVEADGSQHGGPYDQERDSYLRSVGFTVVRIWSWDVIRDLDGVLDEIADALDRQRDCRDLVSPPTNRPVADWLSPKGRVVRRIFGAPHQSTSGRLTPPKGESCQTVRMEQVL